MIVFEIPSPVDTEHSENDKNRSSTLFFILVERDVAKNNGHLFNVGEIRCTIDDNCVISAFYNSIYYVFDHTFSQTFDQFILNEVR